MAHGKVKDSFKLKNGAVPFSKWKQDSLMGAPKKADTSEQDAMLAQQRTQAATLDEEENRKRKQFLSNAQGLRSYRGSIFTRSNPSNTAAVPSAVSAAAASAIAAAAGGRGYSSRGAGSLFQ